jgi:hypothetical protein
MLGFEGFSLLSLHAVIRVSCLCGKNKRRVGIVIWQQLHSNNMLLHLPKLLLPHSRQ